MLSLAAPVSRSRWLEPNSEGPRPYPGDIQPGIYEDNEIMYLLRQHCHNLDAIYFVADLLEE